MTTRDPADLHEIELRAKSRLEDKGLQVEEFDIGHYPENIQSPCVNIGVESGQNAVEIARGTYQLDIVIRMILVCKNFSGDGDEKELRAESLPLLQAVINILLLQDLGLEINKIKLRSFKYRTSPEAFEKGFIVWQVDFETAMNFEATDDEEDSAPDLKSIFVEYFLQDTIEEEKDNPDFADLIDELDS